MACKLKNEHAYTKDEVVDYENTDKKYTGNPKKFYSWCDFGGKVEKEDTNILETIIRELKEETNDI